MVKKIKQTVHTPVDQYARDTICGTSSKKGNLKLSKAFMYLGKDVNCKKCKRIWGK